jgi:hypothetical protein
VTPAGAANELPAVVAPPGSPPVFGWCSSGRGLGPPVRAAGPVSGRPRQICCSFTGVPRAASVLSFPISWGEGWLWEHQGGWLGRQCDQKLGEFSSCPGSGVVPGPRMRGRFWVCFAQPCSRPGVERGQWGHGPDTHSNLESGIPDPAPQWSPEPYTFCLEWEWPL